MTTPNDSPPLPAPAGSARLVPVCQREGCNKHLHRPNERNYLWVRRDQYDRGTQIVVCDACAAEIKAQNAKPSGGGE